MTEYYAEKLQQGLEYQDFVTNILLEELGIALSNYSSKKYQYSVGENKQGIEIKFDDRFKDTRNVYIEVQEKSNANNPNYVDSGILRCDNTWLYVIGDMNIIFIFSKKILKGIIDTGKYKRVQTPTSIGYLIDEVSARKYCAKILEPHNG